MLATRFINRRSWKRAAQRCFGVCELASSLPQDSSECVYRILGSTLVCEVVMTDIICISIIAGIFIFAVVYSFASRKL
jgi:hypothetical protein